MLDRLPRPRLVVVLGDGHQYEAPVSGAGEVTVGPLDVEVADDATSVRWRVGNPSSRYVSVRSIRLRWDDRAVGPVRMFRHGFQSWSPNAWATVGEHVDPARHQDLWLVRSLHHADPMPPTRGECRSEQVTVLEDAVGGVAAVGFLGGAAHAGTLRARMRGATLEVDAEAFYGGAELAPGEQRELHPVAWFDGAEPDALLAAWADAFGERAGARVDAPFVSGWCSWYQWFHDLDEAAVTDTIARAGADGWPFDVIQVDDGWQPAVGDWDRTNERFPSGLDGLAAAITGAGFRPGIWFAPFVATPGSRVVQEHPDWVARWRDGRPLAGVIIPGWGGEAWVLDVTRGDVLAHIEERARAFRDAGFTYVKADFTYAPALLGGFAATAVTPAERVRAGLDAVRRGVGDDTLLLGCGCPIGPAVGVVDAMRIGPDVAPSWDPAPDAWVFEGYEAATPAVSHALDATLARRFQHRRLWANDPDCVLLRRSATALTAEQVDRWADAAAHGGSVMMLSDDLALLDAADRGRFAALLETARAGDSRRP